MIPTIDMTREEFEAECGLDAGPMINPGIVRSAVTHAWATVFVAATLAQQSGEYPTTPQGCRAAWYAAAKRHDPAWDKWSFNGEPPEYHSVLGGWADAYTYAVIGGRGWADDCPYTDDDRCGGMPAVVCDAVWGDRHRRRRALRHLGLETS